MGIPRILLGVPLVLAGMLAPAAGSALNTPPRGVVGMGHEAFASSTTTIQRGERITFQNDSRFIHIVGAGRGGHLAPRGREPINPRLLMEQNDRYTTGAWNTPGTYYMTCSVHPEMTIKIVVTG